MSEVLRWFRACWRSGHERPAGVSSPGPGLAASWLGLVLLLSGCAQRPPDCAAGRGHPMLVVNLYFGRSIPAQGDVTEKGWRDFLDQVVTPNLPNGYTVFDATGSWMNPVTHKTIREATKVLTVAVPDQPESLAAIGRIRNAYQSQFRQELVGQTVHPACGSF